MRTVHRFAALACVLAIALAVKPAFAQSTAWPQRTVRLVIPLPPGTGTDIAGRLLAERLAERWGQPVIVENRQGARRHPRRHRVPRRARHPPAAAVVRRHRHDQPAAA